MWLQNHSQCAKWILYTHGMLYISVNDVAISLQIPTDYHSNIKCPFIWKSKAWLVFFIICTSNKISRNNWMKQTKLLLFSRNLFDPLHSIHMTNWGNSRPTVWSANIASVEFRAMGVLIFVAFRMWTFTKEIDKLLFIYQLTVPFLILKKQYFMLCKDNSCLWCCEQVKWKVKERTYFVCCMNNAKVKRRNSESTTTTEIGEQAVGRKFK